MSTCETPVSWLALERYHLGELAAVERAGLDAHLQRCTSCAASLREIDADTRPLPALPDVSPGWLDLRRLDWNWTSLRWLVLLAAPALAGLLLAIVPERPQASPAWEAKTTWKGGELAISLVRERDGRTSADPTTFQDGDRFKVLLTTPVDVTWIVEITQEEEVFTPLGSGEVTAQNLAPLAGAFALTGDAPATVCAVVDENVRVCALLWPERR